MYLAGPWETGVLGGKFWELWSAPLQHPSSVASFFFFFSFFFGGGQEPHKYRQKKVSYMRKRAKRASASETYIFSPNKPNKSL